MQQMVKLSDDRCHNNILAVSFLFSKYIAIIQPRNDLLVSMQGKYSLRPEKNITMGCVSVKIVHV